VRFPAIAEKDEEHVIRSPYGERKVGRRAGEALHPEREPLHVLETIRHTIGEYNFAGQYQQTPAPLEGGIVKRAWFRLHGPEEWPQKFERLVQSWDTASKASELSDFSVCTTWGIKDKHYYLLNVFRKRLNYPDLKRAVRAQAQEHHPQIILIEDTSSGTQLIQELVAEGFPGVTKYTPNGDKTMRMHAQTATIENGFVHLPRDAHWLEEYLHEVTTFDKGKYDDQVDSTAQALDWIKRTGVSGEAILEYFREVGASRLQDSSQAKVRLRAPVGMEGQQIYVGNGLVTIASDGIVEVSQEQARLLLGNRQGWTRLS
jgi:predicted phage terminase large subunit-like protein